MSKRALRRHHRERLKENMIRREKDLFKRMDWPFRITTNALITVETPTRCSCYICGNPRKWYNEKTLQEVKFYSESTRQKI